MRNLLFRSLVILAAISSLSGQQEPEDLSADLESMIEGCGVPALSAAAVLDGRIVSLGAAGVRKRGETMRVTKNDKFHIGSCTKSMTAALGAMLVEEGRLRWDTTVSEVFPDLPIHRSFKDATLEQFLTNTAGVHGEIDPGLWSALWKREGSEREQRLRLVEGILRESPTYEPGSGQVYSNGGFSIAGAMLEKIMDKPYEELLRERLFEPLKMTSAGFRAPAGMGRIDQPYGHTKAGAVDPEPRGDNPPATAPAGAVHCSVSDFARYAMFHLGWVGDGILTREGLAKLHKPIEGRDYGLGWIVTNREWARGRAITHGGSNTMFSSLIWVAPERDFAAVAMCNCGGEEGFEKCDEAIGFLVSRHLK